MIISRITDGLGNQMFQYAFGYARAKQKKTEFKLDLSWFLTQTPFTPREFQLNKLNISATIATSDEIEKIINPEYPFPIGSLFHRIQYLKPYYKRRLVKEATTNYDPNLNNINKTAYLQGFWQSYKYFENYRSEILDEFQLKEILPTSRKTILDKISEDQESVAIHIRRGDYTQAREKHYTLSIEYYKKAIDIFTRYLKNPHFYIFSEDLNWVKMNFSDEKLSMDFIEPELSNESLDLFLMSKSRHIIIANSTFSWWAAWLNQNESKKVIAPQLWFKDGSRLTEDIYPSSWQII